MRNLLPFKAQILTVLLFCLAAPASAQTSLTYTTPNVFTQNQAISPLIPVISPTPESVGSIIPHGGGINSPWGEAVDTAGNIYVTDYGSNLVKKIALNGTITTLGSGFNGPISVAVDASGNVYVADYFNNAVKKIAPDGVTVTTLGSGFNTPSGVAVDAAGNVYVADNGNSAVKKIAPDGVTVTKLGPANYFNIPWAVAVDAAGNVYVADYGGFAVYKIAPDGITTTTLGQGFYFPTGVAVDAAGNVYVAILGSGTVDKISPDGATVTTLYTGAPYGDPLSVAVDASGNVYEGDANVGVVNEIVLNPPVIKFGINPSLPAGLYIDSLTGIISGTPLVTAPATAYTVTTISSPVGNITYASTLVLSVIPSSITHAIICSSDLPYTWNGTDYNTSGNDTLHLASEGGGDSTAILVLTVLQSSSSTTSVSLYSWQLPYTWNGTDYSSAGTYTFYTNNAAGCDSTATLVLSVTNVQAPPVTFKYNTPNVFVKNKAANAIAPVLSPQPVPVGTVVTVDSGFNQPHGITVDPGGNIFLADYANHLVKKITSGGVVTTFGPAFNTPTGVAADAAGNIYVSDELANTVYKLDPNGNIINSVGPIYGSFGIVFGHYFSNPFGVAVGTGGNVYVADYSNNVIKRILPDGATVTTVGSGFFHPTSVVADATGNIYVADNGNNAVKKIAPDGTITTLGSGFSQPFCVAADATGNVYVSNLSDSTIKKIAPDGITVTNVGKGLVLPVGIAVDAGGNVYASDGGDNTVKKIIVFGQQVSKFTVAPALPAGLNIDTASGIISGTPLVGSSSRNYTVTAVRSAGNITTPVKIAVNVFDTIAVAVCPPSLPYRWDGLSYYQPGSYTTDLILPGESDSAVTLLLTVLKPTSSTTPVTICSPALPYNWNGVNFNAAGSYTIHLTNAAGCDSAATLILTVNQPTAGSTPVTVCSTNLPYNWNGTNYTTAGSYTIHLTNAAGCDSAATLVLTVNQSTTSNTAVTVCSPDLPYNWNGTDYTTAGSYTIHLTNAVGCDSAATLVLTVNQPTASNTSVTVCSPDLPYNWNGTDYTTAGSYTIHLTNVAGCDSAATLILTVNQPTSSSTPVTVCSPDLPYNWNGTDYTTAGSYTIHLTNAAGCDSATTLVLTVNQPTASSTSVTICSPDLPYNWNGTDYTTPGNYTIHLTNGAGCDSATTLVLTVNQPTASSTPVTVCSPDLPYNWNGRDYTTSGNYTIHLTNAAGCDSATTLLLTVTQPTTSITFVNIGSTNLPYYWNGTGYSAAGSYTLHFINAAGCDSAATLALSSNPATSSNITVAICAADLPYHWNGIDYNTSGIYTAHFINSGGSDSTATLMLTVNTPTTSSTLITVCAPALTYNWNGTDYNVPGSYTIHLANAEGCDSAATLILTAGQPTSSSTSADVCSSTLPFYWNGSYYSTAGNYTIHLTNAAGCDSAATLLLTVKQTTSSTTTVTLPQSQLPYKWNGTKYNAAGTYTFTTTNNQGCDSIATLVLTVSNFYYRTPNSFQKNKAINPLLPVFPPPASPGGNIITFTAAVNPVAGVAVDAAGDVYVGDGLNQAVKKIPVGGGKPVVVAFGFKTISGIALDAIGNLYVSDAGNGSIEKIPADQSKPVIIGQGFKNPTGVAVDAAGNVYVAAANKGAIQMIAPDGTVTALGSGILTPVGIAVDAAGNVYVSDQGDNTVKRIQGNTTKAFVMDFTQPAGVAVDAAGNVYVADDKSGIVRMISFDATLVTTIGSGFNEPSGIAVNTSGNINVFVAEFSDIKKITTADQQVNSYTINPGLPAGLAIDAATGIISGTPAVSAANAVYAVSAASNSGNKAAFVEIAVTLADSISICSSALPYLWNGAYYNVAGTYTTTITNSNGSNSIAILILTIAQPSASSTSVTIPSGDVPFIWNGAGYTTSGSYTVHLINAAGCDSAATLVLIVRPPHSSITTLSVCSTDLPYLWNGTAYNTSGTYNVTIPIAPGVDSLPTLDLTVNQASSSTTTIVACPSSLPYQWNGHSYTSAGTYTVHLTNAKGCDSAATLILIAAQPGYNIDSVTVYAYQLPYFWAGQANKYPGTYTSVAPGANYLGCDSIQVLILTVLPAPAPLFNYNTPNLFAANKPIAPLSPVFPPRAAPGGATVQVGFSWNQPKGLATDAAGNLYVVENGGGFFRGLVQKVTPDGTTTLIQQNLASPVGIAVDAADNVYVLDASDLVVTKIPSDGSKATQVAAGFIYPAGLAVDTAGNVYVSDLATGKVYQVSAANGSVATIGPGFSNPVALAVDAAGNVYVVEQGQNAVKKILPDGITVTSLGSGFASPAGVAVDAAGNVYVTDAGNQSIKKISPDGITVTTVGTGLFNLGGIAVNASGNVNIFVSQPISGSITEIEAINPQVKSYAISPALPTGLSINAATGIISGTPLNGSASKTYTVTAVRDSGNITAPVSITVKGLCTLSATSSAPNLQACYGGVVNINVTATNGLAPYQYSLDGVNYQGSRTLTVHAGTYSATVMDAVGCVATTNSFTVTQPATPITVTTQNTAVSCSENTITATAAGGYGGYLYNINGGSYQAGNVFNADTAGSYNVRAKDQKGCSGGKIIAITRLSTIYSASSLLACYGGTTSTSVTANNGKTPYQYSLDGVNYQAANIFKVPAGTYAATVKDAAGCTAISNSLTVTQAAPVAVSTQTGAVSCGNYTITATATGGYGNYLYSLNTGSYQAATTLNAGPAGAYSVHAKDQNGCTGGRTVIINPLTATYSAPKTQVCYGATVNINAVATNGIAPYQYSLDGVHYQATNGFKLAAGTYNITIKDTAGCTATTNSVAITQPATQLKIATAQTNVTCNGSSDGSITTTATGGYGGYLYTINGGSYQPSGVFTGLQAGIIKVTVKDSNSCLLNKNVTITQPATPCTTLSAPIAPTPAAADMTGELKIKVYPNPAVTDFNLEVVSGDSKKVVEIRVVDMFGKKVYHTTGSVFDIYKFGNTFAGGIYIAEVLNGENIQRLKLVKGK